MTQPLVDDRTGVAIETEIKRPRIKSMPNDMLRPPVGQKKVRNLDEALKIFDEVSERSERKLKGWLPAFAVGAFIVAALWLILEKRNG